MLAFLTASFALLGLDDHDGLVDAIRKRHQGWDAFDVTFLMTSRDVKGVEINHSSGRIRRKGPVWRIDRNKPDGKGGSQSISCWTDGTRWREVWSGRRPTLILRNKPPSMFVAASPLEPFGFAAEPRGLSGDPKELTFATRSERKLERMDAKIRVSGPEAHGTDHFDYAVDRPGELVGLGRSAQYPRGAKVTVSMTIESFKTVDGRRFPERVTRRSVATGPLSWDETTVIVYSEHSIPEEIDLEDLKRLETDPTVEVLDEATRAKLKIHDQLP